MGPGTGLREAWFLFTLAAPLPTPPPTLGHPITLSPLLPFTAHVVMGVYFRGHFHLSSFLQTSAAPHISAMYLSSFQTAYPRILAMGRGKNSYSLHSSQCNLLEPQIPFSAERGRSPGHRGVSWLIHLVQLEPCLLLPHIQSLNKHILNIGEKCHPGLGAVEQETAKGSVILQCLYTDSITSRSACPSDGTGWELKARLQYQN